MVADSSTLRDDVVSRKWTTNLLLKDIPIASSVRRSFQHERKHPTTRMVTQRRTGTTRDDSRGQRRGGRKDLEPASMATAARAAASRDARFECVCTRPPSAIFATCTPIATSFERSATCTTAYD